MSRVVTSPGGGSYVERSLGGGVVERRWIVPEDGIRVSPDRCGLLTETSRGRPAATFSRSPQAKLRRHAASRYEVELAENSASAIEREVASAYARFGRFVEQGGYLFSLWEPDARSVVVSHASPGIGPGSRHEHDRVSLPRLEDVEAEFSDTLRRAQLICVGDWHSHPSADATPSSADVSVWSRRRMALGADLFYSLIVTPDRDLGWTSPDMTAWVTRRDGEGVVCEPATLREP